MSPQYLSLLNVDKFLIVCPLVFLAGFIDSIAGGGALISIPAYLIAGLPIHTAIATNKLSAGFGASASAIRFIHNKMINFRLGIPSVIFAILGSCMGANLSMYVEETVLIKILLVLLPFTAFLVLNKKVFHDRPEKELVLTPAMFIKTMLIAFVIGIYDGFFGPGAGTFTIIAFTIFAKMSIKHANAQTKLINLTTTFTALIVFLLHGQILIPLGIAAGLCNMAGSWIGAGFVMKHDSHITKPAILFVLALMAVKLSGVY